MWSIEIVSLQGDSEAIEKILAGSGYSLQKIEHPQASHLLGHPKYEALKNPNEIWNDAKALKGILSRFVLLESSIEMGIQFGSVREHQDDGTFHSHHFAEVHSAITMTLSGTAKLIVNSSLSDEELTQKRLEAKAAEEARQKEVIIRKACCSLIEPTYLQVLELLNIQNPTGTELGHIVDLIIDHCNGDISRFTTKSEKTRFDRSINHPEVLGIKSRHIASQHEPPPKPMKYSEAKTFAYNIANKWMKEIETN